MRNLYLLQETGTASFRRAFRNTVASAASITAPSGQNHPQKTAAQRDREERDDQRGPDQSDERPPRKGGGPRHQGIEPEKQVDRVREDVVVLVLRVQEEEDEKKEHRPLRHTPKRSRRLHPGIPGVFPFRSAMLLLYQRCRCGVRILPAEPAECSPSRSTCTMRS